MGGIHQFGIAFIALKKIKEQRQTGVKPRGYTVGYIASGARMGRKYPGAREQLERL